MLSSIQRTSNYQNSRPNFGTRLTRNKLVGNHTREFKEEVGRIIDAEIAKKSFDPPAIKKSFIKTTISYWAKQL